MSPPDPRRPATAAGETTRAPAAEEPPPVLGRWSRLYWLIVGLLGVEIALFWIFTRAFA